MGRIIKASFLEIYPGEELFTTRILAEIIKTARKEQLFIIPARLYKNGKYINLDGRHRMIYQKLTGAKEVELFLADNPQEIIDKEVYKHRNFSQYLENNKNIMKRWDWVENESNRHWIRSTEYTNYEEYFTKLQEILGYLKDINTCIAHLKKEKYL